MAGERKDAGKRPYLTAAFAGDMHYSANLQTLLRLADRETGPKLETSKFILLSEALRQELTMQGKAQNTVTMGHLCEWFEDRSITRRGTSGAGLTGIGKILIDLLKEYGPGAIRYGVRPRGFTPDTLYLEFEPFEETVTKRAFVWDEEVARDVEFGFTNSHGASAPRVQQLHQAVLGTSIALAELRPHLPNTLPAMDRDLLNDVMASLKTIHDEIERIVNGSNSDPVSAHPKVQEKTDAALPLLRALGSRMMANAPERFGETVAVGVGAGICWAVGLAVKMLVAQITGEVDMGGDGVSGEPDDQEPPDAIDV